MKPLLLVLLLGTAGCALSMPGGRLAAASPTPSPAPGPTAAPATPEAPLGTQQNPLVVALPPSRTQPQGDVLNAGQVLTSLLEKNTGHDFASVLPPTEGELIRGIGNGDTDIAALSPFGYLLASESGEARAAFAREQSGKIFYGAELIAPASGYRSYWDPVQQANAAAAPAALAQLGGRKPCWTDAHSPSGYVVPLGTLKQAGVATREAAFLASHTAVVRALYAGGICDFGATYVGAIDYPGLEDELPDVNKRILVIWRIPAIIPYETLAFSSRIPIEMRRMLTRTLVDLMDTDEGRSAMQVLYGFDAMQIVDDGQYEEFRSIVEASGLKLEGLIDP